VGTVKKPEHVFRVGFFKRLVEINKRNTAKRPFRFPQPRQFPQAVPVPDFLSFFFAPFFFLSKKI
jgi:hypothetical protein